jgi:hypothetical protein
MHKVRSENDCGTHKMHLAHWPGNLSQNIPKWKPCVPGPYKGVSISLFHYFQKSSWTAGGLKCVILHVISSYYGSALSSLLTLRIGIAISEMSTTDAVLTQILAWLDAVQVLQ